MNPTVTQFSQEEFQLTFQLNNINVSLANAIRRVILSDIPIVVFRTQPHSKNLATFRKNTSRMNNELLKQRLECIPVMIDDIDFPIEDYVVEIKKENATDSVIYVTTQDFKVKNTKTDTYISETDNKKMFPPSPLTGYYIDFVRLRPKLSKEYEGEGIDITCKLDKDSACNNGAYNITSMCTYEAVQDMTKVAVEWAKKEKELKAQKEKNTDLIKKEWLLLDAKRLILEDTFKFRIETIGQYSNTMIMEKALQQLIIKIKTFQDKVQQEENIVLADSTIQNCFDVTLVGEDYTVGKCIEYMLYETHYNKTVSFCGFTKPHPLIDKALIRIAFYKETDKTIVMSYLENAAKGCIAIFEKLMPYFSD